VVPAGLQTVLAILYPLFWKLGINYNGMGPGRTIWASAAPRCHPSLHQPHRSLWKGEPWLDRGENTRELSYSATSRSWGIPCLSLQLSLRALSFTVMP